MPGIRPGFVQNVDERDPATIGDLPDQIRADKYGRFTLVGFAPGIRYHLVAFGGNRVLVHIGRDPLEFKAGEAETSPTRLRHFFLGLGGAACAWANSFLAFASVGSIRKACWKLAAA